MAEQFEEGIGYTVGSSLTQQQFRDLLLNLQRKQGTILRNFQDDLTSSFGMFAIDANGDPISRSIESEDASLSVTDGSGLSGNPTIGLGTPGLLREHLATDWEDVTSNGATLTPSKYVHFLKIFTGTPSVTIGPPTGGKLCEKVLINNGGVSITVVEDTANTFAEFQSITLGVGDSAILYSNAALRWYLGATNFLGGKENASSGSLIVGNRYEILKFETGDDFTSVGANANADWEIFTATGDSPTWSNSSILKNLGAGCVNL